MTTVLYIEDDDDSAYMLSRRLGREGFTVRVAPDAQLGIEQVLQWKPYLVLMDLNLPGIDGWEAVRTLKADPRTCPVPIIAVSSYTMGGDRERALAAGCDDYVTKPLDFTSLLAKMQALLPEPDGAS